MKRGDEEKEEGEKRERKKHCTAVDSDGDGDSEVDVGRYAGNRPRHGNGARTGKRGRRPGVKVPNWSAQ